MTPALSVIVPTRGRPDRLVEAVRSALGQIEVDLEVIVVDDAADGSARAAIEALGDPRVIYQRREAPSGGKPALVRAEALQHARGRYVAFLDDDDLLPPGAYRALMDALEASPGAALAFGRVEPFGAQGAQLAHELAFFVDAAHRARQAQWSSSRFSLVAELLFGGSLFVTSAAMMRRERVDQLGGLDPAVDLVEITELAARAARENACLFVDREVARFRYEAGSLVHDPANAERLRQSYQNMIASYRKRRGLVELSALKVFARTFKRFL
jgi:glycosyltransferase involved in cell wall biosynthesis